MSEGIEYLIEYMRIVPTMSGPEFLAEFPHPFLVQAKPITPHGEELPQFTTTRFNRGDLVASTGQLLRLQGQARVCKVVKKEGNVFKDMISVGRARNNDIALPYTSVSKFHAFFRKRGDDGPYVLSDAKSTNRTLVNDEEVKQERARELLDGDIVSFSPKLVFSFYSSEGFYAFVQKILREIEEVASDESMTR